MDLNQIHELIAEGRKALGLESVALPPCAPSARKDDASPFEPAGGLMEQINASIQRGCSI